MADTITIAGKPIPKNALYIGGAAAVGMLAYAYYKRSSGTAAPTDTGTTTDQNLDPSTGLPYGDEFGAGMSYSGLGVYDPATGAYLSAYGTQTVTAVSTNAQWAQAAEAYLVQQGYDASATAAAIGKVLTGQPVTADQAAIWAAAKGFEGEPPQYVPPLNVATSTGQTTTPAGGKLGWAYNLKASGITRTSIHIAWSPVTGATGYHLELNGKNATSVTGTSHTFTGLKANTSYTFGVIPYSATEIGPTSHTGAKTKK